MKGMRWTTATGFVLVGVVLAYATLPLLVGWAVAILCLLVFGWLAIEGPRYAALIFAGLAIAFSSVWSLWQWLYPSVGVSCAPRTLVQSLFCTPPDLMVAKWALLGGFGALVLVAGILLRWRANGHF